MNATVSFKKATYCMLGNKKVNSSKETRRSWYHAIDTKYIHILVKFERRLSLQFGRKKEKQNFFKGMAQPFFSVKNASFLRTEMDNLPSIFTGITVQFISIDGFLERSTLMLYAVVNATRTPKSDQLEWYQKWQVVQEK
jgi:hypothetical protein